MPPLSTRLLAATVVALLLTVFFWLIHVDVLNWGTVMVIAVMGALFIGVPRALAWASGRAVQSLHGAAWWRRQGTHHEFAGIALDVREDTYHLWIEAHGLKRVLRTQEADDVFAARVASGRWVREGYRLWLRGDAVVDYLSHAAPDRTDPRILRFSRWLQTQVLLPAATRRARRPGGMAAPAPAPAAAQTAAPTSSAPAAMPASAAPPAQD